MKIISKQYIKCPAGGDRCLTDCLHIYKPLLADLTSMAKAATNQLVDCMAQGHPQPVCFDKFASIINEINSRVSAKNQKFSLCFEHGSSNIF